MTAAHDGIPGVPGRCPAHGRPAAVRGPHLRSALARIGGGPTAAATGGGGR
ncbi:hypothetical protein [Streptomonospora sediminis]